MSSLPDKGSKNYAGPKLAEKSAKRCDTTCPGLCGKWFFALVVTFVLWSCHDAGTQPARPVTSVTSIRDTGLQPSSPQTRPSLQPAAAAIIAGSSIGSVSLDMNADSVVAMLGQPDRSDAAMGKAWLVWTSKSSAGMPRETAVYTSRNMGVGKEESRVKEIRITSGFFYTQDSLRTGLRLADIRAKRPALKRVDVVAAAPKQFYDDADGGISFEFGAGGVCTAILVHPKGVRLTDVYLPLQP